jgi:hypothetical protein
MGMLFKEINTVYSENQTKRIKTLSCNDTSFLTSKHVAGSYNRDLKEKFHELTNVILDVKKIVLILVKWTNILSRKNVTTDNMNKTQPQGTDQLKSHGKRYSACVHHALYRTVQKHFSNFVDCVNKLHHIRILVRRLQI